MTIVSRYAVVAWLSLLTSILAACGGSSVTSCSLMACSTADAPVSFALSPDSAHILLGDTTHFYTWSCARGPCVDLDESGNLYSNWTITGDAVNAVVGNALATDIAFARRIVVRGLIGGSATIRATAAGDSTKTRLVNVFVADSAVIDTVMLSTATTTVRVGQTITVDARLMGGGTHYIARPTTWASTDSTVLELGATQFERGVERRSIRGLKVGTAQVQTGFRTRQGGISLTVVP